MSCYYAGKYFKCNELNCRGCVDASNYHGEYGTRIYMTDEEVRQTCMDCSCFYECFDSEEQFDLESAKECYNIMFSCCEED